MDKNSKEYKEKVIKNWYILHDYTKRNIINKYGNIIDYRILIHDESLRKQMIQLEFIKNRISFHLLDDN